MSTVLPERDIRLAKLAELRKRGIDPYPKTSKRTATCGQAVHAFDAWSTSEQVITLAGRIMTTRVHGAMIFADLQDESGKMQIALKEDHIGTETFGNFRDLVDPADIVEVTGVLFTTKRGEKTLQVSGWRMLTKALLPLPEKWHGLQDVERRYRERELDLLSNPDVRHRFLVRSKMISALRHFLDEKGYLEVETPMLQAIPGGASARPFVTHHNALDIDLYLRIAPELYLKRLLVGGFEKIYEIGRCFRNEGIDYAHNPEFTMLELYWAYGTKDEFVTLLESMIVHMMSASVSDLQVASEEGAIDFTPPWPRTTFREAIMKVCGIDIDTHPTKELLAAAIQEKRLSVDLSECVGMGECYDQLFKKTARPRFEQPTWVFDYPIELKPLTNSHPVDPSKSACAQLVIRGAEVVNAYYHELHDPVEQRERLMDQQKLRDEGSEEAQWLDEGFLRALEHGMPPTCGMGMGIDRLAALVTNAPNLKEIILFPTLRPEREEDAVSEGTV
jgi:lysyl-tRNA synthetase, class II